MVISGIFLHCGSLDLSQVTAEIGNQLNRSRLGMKEDWPD